MKSTIQAVLFDADGVIVSPQMQFKRHLTEAHNITPEMTLPFFKGPFEECVRGRLPLRTALAPFLQKWGWPGDVESFIATWMQQEHNIDQQLAGAIRSLRQRGYLCALATIQEPIRAAYMRQEMGMADLFDYQFFSCELGCAKPEIEYFEKIEQILKLPPHSLLFWDDRLENITAARQRGWQAEVYTDFPAFVEASRKYRLS